MKFAYLLMFELRAVNKTVKDLYENVIRQYNADVYICVQSQFPDDLDRLELFQENVVYKQIYNKPNPIDYFGSDTNLNLEFNGMHNWNIPSNLQIYINQHIFSQVISNVVDKYDYFILLRCDSQVLFPLPDKHIFENIPEGMYFMNAQYSKQWGDNGIPTFIHRNYIMTYLNSYVEIIKNPIFKNDFIDILNMKGPYFNLNQENFQNICLQLCGLENKIKYIQNINYFWTAEKINDYTTWSVPFLHPEKNVICKYEEQTNEAYKHYELWKNGYTWKTDGNNIYLEYSN